MWVIVNWPGISLTPGGAADTCRLESPSTAPAAGKGKCQPPMPCCQGSVSLPTWVPEIWESWKEASFSIWREDLSISSIPTVITKLFSALGCERQQQRHIWSGNRNRILVLTHPLKSTSGCIMPPAGAAPLALSTHPQNVHHCGVQTAQTRLNSLFKKSSHELMLKNVLKFPSTPIPLSFYLGGFRNDYQETMKFAVLFPTVFFIKHFRRR